MKFNVGGCTDPRGYHSAVVDENNIVVSRAWKESDAGVIRDKLNSGEMKPNYESRYINADVDEFLTE